MSEKLENLIKKANEVDCNNYQLKASEIFELMQMYNNDFFSGSLILFKIGFLKGQRAEKARRKRQNREHKL